MKREHNDTAMSERQPNDENKIKAGWHDGSCEDGIESKMVVFVDFDMYDFS